MEIIIENIYSKAMIYIIAFFVHSKNRLESLFDVSLYIMRHNIQHLDSPRKNYKSFWSEFWVEIKTDKLERV